MGLATTVLGAAEVAAGPTESQWFLGIAFVLAGVLLLAASVVLSRGDWSDAWGRRLGLPAGVIAATTAVYLFLISIRYEADIRLLVWILWAALAVIAVRHLPPPVETDETPVRGRQPTRSIIGVLASAGVGISFVWGLVQLWSTTRHSTSVLGPTLAVSATMERTPELDVYGERGFTARITVTNPTASKVQVVGSLYGVTAVAFEPAAQDHDALLQRAVSPLDRSSLRPHVRRHLSEGPAHLVQFGFVTPAGWYLEPEESYNTQLVVMVPGDLAEESEILRLSADFAVGRGSRLEVLYDEPTEWEEAPGLPETIHAVYQALPIRPPGVIHEFARGRQTMTLVNAVGRNELGEFAAMIPCIDDEGTDPDTCIRGESPKADRWARFYGLVGTTTVQDIPLGKADN